MNMVPAVGHTTVNYYLLLPLNPDIDAFWFNNGL